MSKHVGILACLMFFGVVSVATVLEVEAAEERRRGGEQPRLGLEEEDLEHRNLRALGHVLVREPSSSGGDHPHLCLEAYNDSWLCKLPADSLFIFGKV